MGKINVNFDVKPLEDLLSESYKRNMDTPENFSKWFGDLSNAINKYNNRAFKYPSSKYMTISYEWIKWLKNDNYTDEKIEEFSEYLLDNLNLKHGRSYFIKTGIFSNKFDFNSSCKLSNPSDIGNQFLSMYYTSMILGAHSTNEIVVRDYIPQLINTRSIYNGMPLRPEYRIFVDIDGNNSKLIDVIEYWHPEVMKNGIKGNDLAAYKSEEEMLHEEFLKNKDYVGKHVLNIAKLIESNTLAGKWSIDVMQHGDSLFYLIDCARMDRSALTEFIKNDEK